MTTGSALAVRRRRPVRLGAGLVLLALCLVADLEVGRSGGLIEGRWPLVLLVVGWTVAAGVAAVVLVAPASVGRRRAGLLVLAFAAALQVASLTAGPQLSDDLYRYLWDGHVAASGIDPYAYSPDSPALVGVRTPFLWPSTGECDVLRAALPDGARADPFMGLGMPGAGCTLVNRREVRTIYPPAAELAFRAADLLLPADARELSAQLPAALTSLGLTGLLVLLLVRAGRSPAWALLYAAGPLAGLEAGMDAHVDVLAALLGVLAVALLAGRASTRRAVLAGVVVAVATLVKLYPAVLGVLALARYGRSRLSAAFVAAGALTAALLYLPHVLAVGVEVLGYLPGYLRENQYASGQRFLLLGLFGLGRHTGILVALVLLVVLVLALRPLGPEPDVRVLARRTTWLLGAAMLAVTPGNAWYCSLLIGCAVLAARPEWLGVVVASYVVYGDALLGTASRWPTLTYGAAAALVVGVALWRGSTASSDQNERLKA